MRTRATVRDVAAQLGYVPRRAARLLASGLADSVGLLLPQYGSWKQSDAIDTDWYAKALLAMSRAVFDQDLALVLIPENEESAVRKSGVSGLVLLDAVAEDARATLADRLGLPYVAVGGLDSGRHHSSVAPDNLAGTHEIVRHLQAVGAQRICILTTDMLWSVGLDEIDRKIAQDLPHMEVSIEVLPLQETGSPQELWAMAAARVDQILSGAHPPDAFVGRLEGLGHAIIGAVVARGLRVPQDVRVVQDVDGLMARLSDPPVSALDLHIQDQSWVAVTLMTELLAGEPGRHVTTPVTFHPRASSVGTAR